MFKVNSLGISFTHPDGVVIKRPNGSGDYLFVFFLSKGYFYEHGKMKSFEPNTCVIYKKGDSQHYGSDDFFKNHFIHFDIEDEHFFEKIEIKLNVLHELFENSSKIQNNLYSIFKERLNSNPFNENIIDILCQLLFYRISQVISINLSDHIKYIQHFNELRNEIYLNPSNTWKLDEMAEKVGLSKCYFTTMFKNIYKITPISDVINSKIQYAKQLLMTSDNKVAYIANQCGYTNGEHFLRQFKKTVGVTPTEFRHIEMEYFNQSKL